MEGTSRVVLLAVTAGLASCGDQLGFSDPPWAPVDPMVVEAASSAYTDCLTREADRIDDGKVSPIGLALKVIPACEKQFTALEFVAQSGSDRFARHIIRNNLEQDKEEYVTRVVLHARLAHTLPP